MQNTLHWHIYSPFSVSSSKFGCCEPLGLISRINLTTASNNATQIYFSLFCSTCIFYDSYGCNLSVISLQDFSFLVQEIILSVSNLRIFWYSNLVFTNIRNDVHPNYITRNKQGDMYIKKKKQNKSKTELLFTKCITRRDIHRASNFLFSFLQVPCEKQLRASA